MLSLLAQAAQQVQQAAPQVSGELVGGGIVGGIVTAAGGLYLIWEKVSKRRTEARRERLADEAERLKLKEQELKLQELARKKIAEEYEHLMGVRKAERDAQIELISTRLTELESREQKCQSECKTLKEENATQAAKIREMEGTITSLRSEIASLTERLKANGSLPAGTDVHTPLKG